METSYKEKYEQALAKAKEQYNYPCMRSCMGILEEIFPELAKSEDEKVRKELIDAVQGLWDNDALPMPLSVKRKDKWLAWLEKQGEQDILEDAILDGNEDGLIAATIEYSKKKPKFKIGDFIANDYCFGKVIALTDDAYLLDTEQGIPFSCEHNTHLWTIADAKDGDILVNGSNIFMFHFINDTRLMGYCHVNTDNGRFYDDIGKIECFCLIDAVVKPATIEQYDLLFQKMKEAGYTFDFEKKELKKIEDEEYNGEDYGIDSLYHAQRILEKTLGSVEGYQSDDGILEHKCAISAVKKLYEQNHAWSDEDGMILSLIVNNLKFIRDTLSHDDKYTVDVGSFEGQIEWLKSLKEKIGGKV